MEEPDAVARASGPAAVSREPLSSLEAMAELARIDFARYDLRGVLEQIAGLARACMVGAGGEVSLTLIRGPKAYTAAFTGEPAMALDETQYDTGYGPCLDAAVSGQVQHVADMTTDTRWPDFARAATGAGIFSSLSLPLPLVTTITGALNVYSAKPAAFDGEASEDGCRFADYAAVAIANAHLYTEAATQAAQLRDAMEYRGVIEQAKGIIMADRRCTAEEAFEILRRVSNDTNRKLRDIADMLVIEATRPRRTR
jgi:GAF domain-containing protein